MDFRVKLAKDGDGAENSMNRVWGLGLGALCLGSLQQPLVKNVREVVLGNRGPSRKVPTRVAELAVAVALPSLAAVTQKVAWSDGRFPSL